MSDLPHLDVIYDKLRRGYHFAPDDGEPFDAMREKFGDYERYFGAIGLTLVRHEREFFYFESDESDVPSKNLAKIAVFSYILIDHYANQGRSIEGAVIGPMHFLPELPHFTLDRYIEILRQVEILDRRDLSTVIDQMQRIGWVRRNDRSPDEFVFLRPFYRIFSKCVDLAAKAAEEKKNGEATAAVDGGEQGDA